MAQFNRCEIFVLAHVSYAFTLLEYSAKAIPWSALKGIKSFFILRVYYYLSVDYYRGQISSYENTYFVLLSSSDCAFCAWRCTIQSIVATRICQRFLKLG